MRKFWPLARYACWFLICAALAFIGACLVYLVLDFWQAEFGGWNTIEKWQTLITGILAVFAATATVVVMMITDRAQQQRHEDALALNVKSDRLRVQRAARPNVDMMERNYQSLRELLAQPESTEDLSARYVVDVRTRIHNLIAAIKSAGIKDASTLFEPELYFSYSQLIASCTNLEDVENRLGNLTYIYHDDDIDEDFLRWANDDSHHWAGYVIDQACRVVGDVHAGFHSFIRGLEKLANSYDKFNGI